MSRFCFRCHKRCRESFLARAADADIRFFEGHEMRVVKPQFVWEDGTPRLATAKERAEEEQRERNAPKFCYVCGDCAAKASEQT